MPDKRLAAQERERRAALLRAIDERVARDGARIARPHADRARQFMPFAALKGYHELAREQERVRQPRQDTTDERAGELSRALARIGKGSLVRIVHYEDGAYQETQGMVSECSEALRTVTVVRRRIAFDDILDIEDLSR